MLDLPVDLLHSVLAHLVSDELALLRAGATCKAMRAMATTPELWCTALLAFFDGELPPALASLEWQQRPLQLLREQVLCARQLMMLEREQTLFQAPEVGFPDARAWAHALDTRIADEQIKQGTRHARPGRPYYGCSGGAYSDKSRFYGGFVKATRTNSVAVRMFGEAEGTLTAWAQVPMHKCVPGPKRSGLFDGDFGPMAKWRDEKLCELAAASPATGASALADKLVADALDCEKRGVYRSKEHTGPDVNPSKDEDKKPADPRLLSLPKLLSGLHGGLFAMTVCGTSIGPIYALDCEADGSRIDDYSDM